MAQCLLNIKLCRNVNNVLKTNVVRLRKDAWMQGLLYQGMAVSRRYPQGKALKSRIDKNHGVFKDKEVAPVRRVRIAVPLFNERIAPHFGASAKVLLVEMQGGSVLQKTERDLGVGAGIDLARRLLNLRVDRLVCGGIQRSCKEWLIQKGVSVQDNQKGSVDELIETLTRQQAVTSFVAPCRA